MPQTLLTLEPLLLSVVSVVAPWGETVPDFPGGVKLFFPPGDIFETSAKHGRYVTEVRDQTAYLMKNHPRVLETSLRAWISALSKRAP